MNTGRSINKIHKYINLYTNKKIVQARQIKDKEGDLTFEGLPSRNINQTRDSIEVTDLIKGRVLSEYYSLSWTLLFGACDPEYNPVRGADLTLWDFLFSLKGSKRKGGVLNCVIHETVVNNYT